MCDVALLNIANQINGDTQYVEDLYIPTITGYTLENCGGAVDNNNAYTSKTYWKTYANVNTYDVTGWKSFYIPYNVSSVRFCESSECKYSSYFRGPYLVEDVKNIDWQTGTEPNKSMNDIPPTLMYVLQQNSLIESGGNLSDGGWLSYEVPRLCAGSHELLDVYSLLRWEPQSLRCDALYTDFCSETKNIDADICACFKEQKNLIDKEDQYGVLLPVICFGQKCATGIAPDSKNPYAILNPYKTSTMVGEKCNLTVCQQIIKGSGNAIATANGSDTIFCGNSIFTPEGDNPVSNDTGNNPIVYNYTPKEKQPIWTYVFIAVAALIFLLLTYLMFSNSLENDIKVQKQINLIRFQHNQLSNK